jgi:hypothetical protein
MLPGFNTWKNETYMDLTEGFEDMAKKERFTMDELDKIIEAEETNTTPRQPSKPIKTAKGGAEEEVQPPVVAEEETPVVAEEDQLAELDNAVITTTTKADVAAAASNNTNNTVKEGFQGYQYSMLKDMKLGLAVFALTALSFVLYLPETDRFIRLFIRQGCYALIARLAIFAVLAYLLLLVIITN